MEKQLDVAIILNGAEKLNSAVFSFGITVGSLEEFQKNSTIICKILIRDVEKYQLSITALYFILIFKLFWSEFFREEAEYVNISDRNSIGILSEKQLDSAINSTSLCLG